MEIDKCGANSKEIKGTVASLRLDAVLGLGFGISRGKAVNTIKAGDVEVNGEKKINPSIKLKEKDVIVLRERSTIEVTSVEGKTRRGRQSIVLKKIS